MKHLQLLTLCWFTAAITACGGGSSDPAPETESTPDSAIETTDTEEAAESDNPASVTLTGRFIDSSVTGLQYASASQSGVTGSNGEFSYLENEAVTFSLGDLTLPAVIGADIVTPLDVFSTENIDDLRVQNLLRLLQTLDIDANPDNGITLSDEAIASATGLTADFASGNFDQQVINLVANSGSSNTTLIDAESAVLHFEESLMAEGLLMPPEATVNTSAHPLVGTTAEFRNFFHDVGGTLTILDDRTLQVTNFTYDGDGPSVYFYTGTDGGYSSAEGGEEIGPQLSGRAWNNETITLNLPAGITLDDFNGVSVWCDRFNANFGDAIF